MSVDATDGRPLHLVQLLLREQLLVSADILASFLPTAALATARVVDPLLCEIYITRGNIASARLQRTKTKKKNKQSKKKKKKAKIVALTVLDAFLHRLACCQFPRDCMFAGETNTASIAFHLCRSVASFDVGRSLDPSLSLARRRRPAQRSARQSRSRHSVIAQHHVDPECSSSQNSVWEQLLAQNAASITAADCVCAARLYRSRSNISAACNAYARGLNLQCAALEIIIGLLEVSWCTKRSQPLSAHQPQISSI
jgi:hypothetical protein